MRLFQPCVIKDAPFGNERRIHLTEKFTLPKFAEALPKSELSTYVEQRLYDEPSARKIIAMSTIQVEF